MSDSLSRRTLLLGGVGALAAGCVTNAGRVAGAPATPSSSSASPSGTTTVGASGTSQGSQLPAVTPWHPSPGDIEPWVKRTAVRHIEQIGNRRDAAPQVLEAQYGGLLSDAASVLVVTRRWRRHGQRIRAGGTTFDVRVNRTGSGWRVTAVHPSRPGPPVAAVSSAAQRVLSSDRIKLPPAARADVESGQVHDSVLNAMLQLAGTFRIGVSIVRSGHPIYVFGTTRPSDHPLGRAFDTWTIDCHDVVDPATPRQLVTHYMNAAATAGSYNVGGPYLLGSAPQFFSDATHHDHVHAGFLT